MVKHKLVPYWIRVREKGDTSTFWDLTDLHEYDTDFSEDNLADIFENFCQHYHGDVDRNRDDKETFAIDLYERSGNTIEGLIKTGDYGQRSDFYDTEEDERIPEARKEKHSEEIPYYFLFNILDSDPTRAIFVLKKFGRRGIKGRVESRLKPMVDQGSERIYFEMNPVYTTEVEDKLEEADDILTLRLRGSKELADVEEYATRNSVRGSEAEVHTEFKMRVKSEDSFTPEFIMNFLDDSWDYSEIIDEDFSSGSVTFVEDGSPLTFSLWREKIQLRRDIDPDDLDLRGGHPTTHSVGEIARELANSFNSDLETTPIIPDVVQGTQDEEADESDTDDGVEVSPE